MAITGMISQHFHHPETGAVAILRMPAGWSKNSYFILSINQPGHPLREERVDCDSPAAARAGAIERQRVALADGWLMGPVPTADMDQGVITMYRNGQRIDCDIVKADLSISNSPLTIASGPMVRDSHAVLEVVFDGRLPVEVGDRIVVRREYRAMRSQWAMRVDRVVLLGTGHTLQIAGTVVETDDSDSEYIDREAAIQRCADLPEQSGAMDFWEALADAYPDTSERREAVHRAITIRQQRRAAAAQADREQREQERRRLAERLSAQPSGLLRPGRHNVPQAQTAEGDEAIKRLSGGQMPGEKHKRRINLGE